ncbi:MAG: hypothetical protein M3O36_12110 [Myxococcota bacterium]|nr:hypothetical protein [Myxococcota bacterium]
MSVLLFSAPFLEAGVRALRGFAGRVLIMGRPAPDGIGNRLTIIIAG